MENKVRGAVEMTTAMTISGTIGWVVLLSAQPVLDVVFWRCVFGAATLLIVCAMMGLFRRTLTIRRLLLAVLGGIAIVLNWLLLFASYHRSSISIATAVYNTQPFMLVGLGALFLSEKLTLTKILWLLIAFSGVLMIVLADPGMNSGKTGYISGIMMSLGAAFLYAVSAILTKKLTGTPPHLIALIHVCTGVVIIAPFAHLSHLPAGVRPWSMLLTIGVIHTGLVYILLYGAIQRLPTHLTGSLSFIYPVVAILVDFLAFGRRLHSMQWIGITAILLAAAGTNLGWSLWKPRRRVQELDCQLS
jgi:drug/metabolite transporter (DMT)-like permease